MNQPKDMDFWGKKDSASPIRARPTNDSRFEIPQNNYYTGIVQKNDFEKSLGPGEEVPKIDEDAW